MIDEAKKYRKYLVTLTDQVRAYIAQVDALMKSSHSGQRDSSLAKLSNALEIENDKARYFGLGVDYRTGKPRK